MSSPAILAMALLPGCAALSAQGVAAKTASEIKQAVAPRVAPAPASNAPQSAEEAQFTKARQAADRILASSEFAAVDQASWLDRTMAKFWNWVGRIFLGVGRLGAAGPWIGRLLEFTLFGGSAIGLALLVRRSLLRQRLAVTLNQKMGELAWDREAHDWAAQAEQSASTGDWRDAVHCLYWATIVMLEERRAWRHNPARTPREYVRLLKPGSPQQGALRRLTQIFERLWYGLREASQTDFERARHLYEDLRDRTVTEAA